MTFSKKLAKLFEFIELKTKKIQNLPNCFVGNFDNICPKQTLTNVSVNQ
jgi:hypothetical protein